MAMTAMAFPAADLVTVMAIVPAMMLGESRRRGQAEPGDGDGRDGGEFQDLHIFTLPLLIGPLSRAGTNPRATKVHGLTFGDQSGQYDEEGRLNGP
jgi:hypothetical protein